MRTNSLFEFAMRLETERLSEISERKRRRKKLYQAYRNMLYRCDPRNADHFPRYAGRGIKVCEEWKKSFDAFRLWSIAHGYDENGGRQMSIDRIDNDGDYSPENCQWTDYKTQQNNRSSNVLYLFNGKKLTQTEFCKEANVSYSTVSYWRKKGLSTQEITSKFL